MKLIELTQWKFAIVDDEDFEYLNQWKWCVYKNGNTHYVNRRISVSEGGGSITMHRQLLGLKYGDVRLVDHKDHNGLNNQKSNLRICTKRENTRNKSSIKNSSSKYLGVDYSVKNRKHISKITGKEKIYPYSAWFAHIGVNGKQIHIGTFKTEENAAIAYNIYAEKYFGEFANYNKA